MRAVTTAMIPVVASSIPYGPNATTHSGSVHITCQRIAVPFITRAERGRGATPSRLRAAGSRRGLCFQHGRAASTRLRRRGVMRLAFCFVTAVMLPRVMASDRCRKRPRPFLCHQRRTALCLGLRCNVQKRYGLLPAMCQYKANTQPHSPHTHTPATHTSSIARCASTTRSASSSSASSGI